MRREGRLPQPFYVVVTDYLAHGTWLVDGVARYFLPSELTRADLVRRGVPDEQLVVSGIPVRLAIAEPNEAAAARARHGLPPDRPVVTLFGGGIDPQRVRTIVTGLLASQIPGVLVVVAGRNEALQAAISDLSDGPVMTLRTLAMVDYVDDLVVASDLIVTKAGGLIVSEVLARGTPLVITEPIPGQEEWNADLVTASGAGLQIRAPELVAPTAIHLLLHPERRQQMREQALFVGRPRAAFDIAERVMADLATPPNLPI
jgi:processive 1,2-diacylglycerol beta-glucosyltransferase